MNRPRPARALGAVGGVMAAAAVALVWIGTAAADGLPGCASGTGPGQVVFTVGVSASGTPFVSTYVASPPSASGNVGCTSPAASPAPTFSVNGAGVAVYPLQPVSLVPYAPAITALPAAAPLPATVHLLQVGSYLLAVPANPALQVYQIAPGFYVVRSLDPSQPASVILPTPGLPAAPNTGPVPSVIH